MPRLTFLRAHGGGNLTKSYRWHDGKLEKQSAPRVQEFDLEFVEYHDAETLFQALDDAAHDPSRCLIRGKPSRFCRTDGGPIYRRATTRPGYAKPDGSMMPQEQFEKSDLAANVYWLQSVTDQPTDFACLDIDGGDWKGGSDDWADDLAHTAEVVRDNLLQSWLHGVSCWVQATGSALDPTKPEGAERNALRIRLAFKLTRGLTQGQLKRLFKGIPNLDTVTLQIHQPIYVAHPVFARGCYDHIEQRSAIAWGERDEAEPPPVPEEAISDHLLLGEIDTAEEGTGLESDERFEEMLASIDGTGGSVRSRLIAAASGYAERHCSVDLGAMANRLAEEALKHRARSEVAGYGIPALVSWAVAAGQSKRRPDPPFELPAGAANDDSPEPAEPPVDLSVEEASSQLEAVVRGWVAEGLAYHPDPGTAPPHKAIKAAAGIGKTTVTLQALAELAAGKTVHFYVPNHNLAEELQIKAEALGIPSRIVQGRGRINPRVPRKPDGSDNQMCLKSEVAKLVAKAGLPVWETMCKSKELFNGYGRFMQCEHFDYCYYVKQFDGLEGRLIIMPHNWLTLPRSKVPAPDLVVIDERFFPIGIRGRHWPWSRITRPLPFGAEHFEGFDPAEHVATAEAVSKALWQGEHPRQHGVTVEMLERAARAEGALGNHHLPHPAMSQAYQRRIVKEHEERAEHRALAKIYRMLAADFDMPGATPRVHVVKGRKTPDGLTDDVFCHWTDYRLPGAPTLLIDADVDPVITEAIMPGVEMVEIEPAMQAKVVQVHDTACSRRKLTEDNASARTLAKIASLAAREANQRKRVLLVGYKPAIKAVGDIDGVSTLWFGNLRGLDAYKNYDTVIIAGREQSRAIVAEATARALFHRDEEPLVLPGEYVTERRRYRTRDGHARFGVVQVHPDSRVQRIVEQSRECETVQAVARLRLVHRVEPAEVFLLSSMPTSLIVDEFTAWGDLMPDKREQAAQESGDVVLMTASEMARCYPERWPTTMAAKKWLGRQKNWCRNPYRDPLGKTAPVSYYGTHYPVSYRCEASGSRGPACRAMIPLHMDKLEAEAALAAIVGPLIMIDHTEAPESHEQRMKSSA